MINIIIYKNIIHQTLPMYCMCMNYTYTCIYSLKQHINSNVIFPRSLGPDTPTSRDQTQLPELHFKVVSGDDPRAPAATTLTVGELASIVVSYQKSGNDLLVRKQPLFY